MPCALQAIESALAEACARHNAPGAAPLLGVVRLSGSLHCEERAALSEAARQLCAAFGLSYAASASYSDNLAFLRDMLAQAAA